MGFGFVKFDFGFWLCGVYFCLVLWVVYVISIEHLFVSYWLVC